METPDNKVSRLKNFAAINTNFHKGSEASLSAEIGSGNHDLLNDPNLIEDYSDIVKHKIDTEGSVSGSVVITPTSNASPLKMLSDQVAQQMLVENDLKEETQEDFDDLANTYNYSDSDFEDNLEKRLKDMDINNSDYDGNVGEEIPLDFDSPNINDNGQDISSSEYDFDINNGDQEPLDIEVKKVNANTYANNDDDDSASDTGEVELEITEDDSYEQLPPPKELDPEKLYALYTFDGPDPSHCKLEQDEACVLLNDQDSYWWLVRKCKDNKIGFAPAEILETFPERLARLNCWKNENMTVEGDTNVSVNDSIDLSNGQLSDSDKNDSKLYKTSDKSKSVSFSNVINYAERIIEQTTIDGDVMDEEDGNAENITSRDKYSEGNINDLDDDMTDVVSDVSFATGPLTPLNIRKTRETKTVHDSNSKRLDVISAKYKFNKVDEIEKTESGFVNDDEQLHKIFEAPTLPFNNNKLHKSNSDYSISTIGEYSPSSSEMTNDSPKITDNEFKTDTSRLPSSKAIKGISGLVDGDEDENDKEEGGEEDREGEMTPTSPKASQASDDLNETNVSNANIADISKDKGSNTNINNSSTNVSYIDDFYMESEKIPSTISISSTYSPSNSSPSHKSDKNNQHPLIENLYNPIFNKMDALLKLIDDIEQ
ncbi:hypothetical protein TPHA_0A04310 [Tetrapisispora phaffii CBS 4417]|uniref:SH3 domain-containing protein n=1 Tax=Tetrapisispora phaffii (strain ATCC 24235 / CBS 4417 / NBRC 1672 / NRRL Y-8282 / UCD 70-5) TaxID=1071381 RepID=G8BNM7_TETPH|nr:hypothetical protein TPHA_0A04310 [Tetrapisispora phaffii CBS 4417]CCE61505.1 hypothetical protein TPHA_0A04310 [Tetrapisispora phaffii CBS 4417]